jgi:hypothetical protein
MGRRFFMIVMICADNILVLVRRQTRAKKSIYKSDIRHLRSDIFKFLLNRITHPTIFFIFQLHPQRCQFITDLIACHKIFSLFRFFADINQ